MGFNKRYLSEESIRLRAKRTNVEDFITYFKADGFITEDEFSHKIYNEMMSLFNLSKEERDAGVKNIMKYCN
jgi:hypothetical protein